MRFTVVAAIFGLAAFATAQNSTTAAAPATSVAPTKEQQCLATCGVADICCKARCVNVPCPTDLQANSTTECAAKCPQGSGSQSDTEKYAACQQACISSSFFPLSATAAPTGGSGSSQASTTRGSGAAASGSATVSGGAAAATTSNAASGVRFGATGVGLLGLFVAGLAL